MENPTKQYPNTGALFYRREKRTENGPDIGGDFEISDAVLQYIIQQVKSGARTVKLEMSGWRKTDRKGQAFYSTRIRSPYNAAPQYTPQPQQQAPALQQQYAPPQQVQQNGYAQQKAPDYMTGNQPADTNPWEL